MTRYVKVRTQAQLDALSADEIVQRAELAEAERDEACAALRTLLDAIGEPAFVKAVASTMPPTLAAWMKEVADAAAAVTANPQPHHTPENET